MENDLRTLLNKHNLSLKKAYGQNFLTDKNLLDESVAKYDSVIEENETIINEISKVFQQEI